MRGRKNPTTNQTAPNLPPCKVCGEQGTGFHYGVTACGACKGFFRRSLVRREPYVCIGNGNCVIGPETKRRKSCPKCRHEKCLSVGMSKEAIKTGRYSYVKKSHDIIEMIEHHFQHFVKRSEHPNGKTHKADANEYFESPRKKIRSSCALEKISEVRAPGGEFMELSPTTDEHQSESIFQFHDGALGNGSVLPTDHLGDLTIADTMRNDIPEDISISNDSVCPSTYGHGPLVEANDELQLFCSDFEHPDFSYCFSSHASVTPSSVPSPHSTGSPVSDVSNSLASSAPISPFWQESSAYSDSPYSDMSLDDRYSHITYPDCEANLETCFKQQEQYKSGNHSYGPAYYTTTAMNDPRYDTLDAFANEISFPFQAYTTGQNNPYVNTAKPHETASFNKQEPLSQSREMAHPHTPVSNELERLRRISWDDMNFTDDFLFPFHSFVTEKTATKNTETPSNINDKCFLEGNTGSIEIGNVIHKTCTSPESGDSCYWDLDNREPRIHHVSSFNETVHKNDKFNFADLTKMESPDSLLAPNAAADACISSITVSSQQQIFNDGPVWSSCENTAVLEKSQNRHYSGCCSEPSCQLTISDANCVVSSAPTLSFSEKDLTAEPNQEQTQCAASSTMTFEKPSEPLNFLNIPLQTMSSSALKSSERQLDTHLAYTETPFDHDGFSPNSEDRSSEAKSADTDILSDDEILERWTPFSLCSEAPRSMEQDNDNEKKVRLQENDDDYNNKPLPWCEFTEAELDDIVLSLKSSYQKHVVLDNNLLSDEEIAEKLKSFLDILQLREQTYGKFAPIDREAYIKILEATGIDVDGRRDWVEINAKIMNRTLQKTIRFFRSVPGFRDICHEDKIVLAKSCMYEYTMLSTYRGANPEKQIIIDAEHKLALNMDFFQVVAPEMKEHILEMFDFSRKLVDLKLTFEESLILKAISITSPDRDKLQEYEKVDRMYWRLHCCLLLSLWRRHSSPLLFYAQIISALTELRGLSFSWRKMMCSVRRDMLKLTKDVQVPLYLELFFAKTDTVSDPEAK